MRAESLPKGEPSEEPKQPGRKAGEQHGRHARAKMPERWDRELDAPLADACPHCGSADIAEERVADQFQTDIPPVEPTVTKFRVHVGHCRGCNKRVQGCHPEQTSAALCAAGAQIGPHAKALAVWLHYQMGLSFGRCAEVLAQFGVRRGPRPVRHRCDTWCDLLPVTVDRDRSCTDTTQVARHGRRSGHGRDGRDRMAYLRGGRLALGRYCT